jgi:hypothetical protein
MLIERMAMEFANEVPAEAAKNVGSKDASKFRSAFLIYIDDFLTIARKFTEEAPEVDRLFTDQKESDPNSD